MSEYRRGSGGGYGRDRYEDSGRDRHRDSGRERYNGGGGRDSGRDRHVDAGGKGKSGKGGSRVEEDTTRDWECDKCQNRNFAKRMECFKCKTARPGPAEEEPKDPRAERERKLKAAIAMGIDPEMAETVIQDPRFADSIEQYERMQKTQEDQQKAAQQQYQRALQAHQAVAAPDPQQLLAMAMAQGFSAEQAQSYVAQYMQQQRQQQQHAAEAAAAPAPPEATPDPSQLLSAAIAQGYTPEQAQLYVQQYMQQQQQQDQQQQQIETVAATAIPQPAASSGSAQQEGSREAKDAAKVALYANVPLILNLDEGSKGQYRTTLKAVIVDTVGGRRTFQDVFVKGPWRRRREAAMKDQEEVSTAFKYDGKKGVEKRVRELEDTTWKSEELQEVGQQVHAANACIEDDDFDAEAESEAEPETELEFTQEELPVKVKGLQQFEGPIRTWEEGVIRGCVAPAVGQALLQLQLPRPTLIQRYALPLISRSGADLLAQAQTGSGKTLAFVIPIISRLLMTPAVSRPFFPGPKAQASPIALMLSPTRELAIQTSKNVSDLLRHSGSSLSVITMYGGETISQQLKPIEKQNQDIICATPGRLLDAIDSGKVSLMFATTVVLDEADQMLDLAVGLEGTVTQVTDGRDLPRNDGRQTLLFSATMPDFQTKQFHAVLKRPPHRLKLRVGHYNEDEKGGSCRHITQSLIRVRDMDDRWARFGRDLMEVWGSTVQTRGGKGIVFTNRIAMAGPLEQALRRVGISSGQLHGKQTQDVREDVVKRFRTGEYEMLIASNVASRGLDFPDIKLVVQFELPKTVEIYTHRIGRTGRNGQTGMALSYFWDAGDWRLAKPLCEFMRLNEQAVPIWLDEMANPGMSSSHGHGIGRRRSRSRSRGRDHRGRGW